MTLILPTKEHYFQQIISLQMMSYQLCEKYTLPSSVIITMTILDNGYETKEKEAMNFE